MKAVVERVLAGTGDRLVEKDVGEDPELHRRYRLAIPVLLRDGVEIARHRATEDDLRRRIAAPSQPR